MLGLDPVVAVMRAIILFISLPVHELAHAYTANAFGDDTPRANGRLSLNPLAHLDVLGSLMLVFAGFGWAKPVPVNLYALERRSSAAPMWVALAGPMSNLGLAALAAIPLWLGLVPFSFSNTGFLPTPYVFLREFIFINLLLVLFNLLPIYPLDGEKVAVSLFPPNVARVFETIRPYGPLILLAVVFLLPRLGLDVFGMLIRPVLSSLLRLFGVPL